MMADGITPSKMVLGGGGNLFEKYPHRPENEFGPGAARTQHARSPDRKRVRASPAVRVTAVAVTDRWSEIGTAVV